MYESCNEADTRPKTPSAGAGLAVTDMVHAWFTFNVDVQVVLETANSVGCAPVIATTIEVASMPPVLEIVTVSGWLVSATLL